MGRTKNQIEGYTLLWPMGKLHLNNLLIHNFPLHYPFTTCNFQVEYGNINYNNFYCFNFTIQTIQHCSTDSVKLKLI